MKLNINSDKIGICVSFFCLIHCLSIPLFLLFGFDSILRFVDQEWLEWTIITFGLCIGVVSFLGGFKAHKQHFISVLFVAGFLLLVNGELISNTLTSVSLSISGVLVIIYAHVQNLKWKRHAIAR